MKIIAQKAGKADKYDAIRFITDAGKLSSCAMPRQGVLPHDLVHFVVESALATRHGFLGLLAGGAELGFLVQQLHEEQHPEVEVQAMQVESIVEALQTQVWAGQFDEAMFLYAVEMACQARAVPVYDFAQFAVSQLYQQALELAQRWQSLPYFAALELDFPPLA